MQKDWTLDRVNQGWKMLRVEGNGISVRDLTRWEKIKLFFTLEIWHILYQYLKRREITHNKH